MWFWVSIFSLPTETFTMYCFNVSIGHHFIYSYSPLKPKLVSSELWLRVDVQYLHNLHTLKRQEWKSSFLFLEKYGNGLYVWNQTGWTTNLGHSRNVQQQKHRSLIIFAFYLLSSFFSARCIVKQAVPLSPAALQSFGTPCRGRWLVPPHPPLWLA